MDPKVIFQGNPLAGWKKIVYPVIERAVQIIIACGIVISAAVAIIGTYIVLRLLWVILRAAESAL